MGSKCMTYNEETVGISIELKQLEKLNDTPHMLKMRRAFSERVAGESYAHCLIRMMMRERHESVLKPERIYTLVRHNLYDVTNLQNEFDFYRHQLLRFTQLRNRIKKYYKEHNTNGVLSGVRFPSEFMIYVTIQERYGDDMDKLSKVSWFDTSHPVLSVEGEDGAVVASSWPVSRMLNVIITA